jgi:hypothetical protein
MVLLRVLPLICVLALFGGSVQSACATMIVVISTKDGFWIGADSARSTSKGRFEDVCKIHETRFGLLIKAGDAYVTRETGEEYSTDQEIQELLRSSDNMEDFQTRLRERFESEIEEEMVILIDNPAITTANLHQAKMSKAFPRQWTLTLERNVIMFDTNKPDSVGKLLISRPDSYEDPDFFGRNFYQIGAESVWQLLSDSHPMLLLSESPLVYPRSVNQFAYAVSYEKTDDWVQAHPQKAIEEILDRGYKERPDQIGPPYSIVHVKIRPSGSSKVEWKLRGSCPKWSNSINADSNLFKLRDDMRAAARNAATQH